MRRVFLFPSLAIVAACAPAATTANDVPTARNIAKYERNGDLYKICDQGRAIYISSTGYSGGLAVVENASECGQ